MRILCATLWLVVSCLYVKTHAQTQEIKLVKDINVGTPAYSDPEILACLSDSSILFIANDGIHGRELWRSDGTATGTYMVKDIVAGPTDGMTFNYSLSVNNKLFFAAADKELWESDGTAAGTRAISADSFYMTGDVMAWYKGVLYFNAYTRSTGKFDIWCSDGTSAGTYKFKNKLPNYIGDKANDFVVAMGKLFFVGESSTYGTELWVTDGSNVGTYMVKDLLPVLGSGVVGRLQLYKNRLYFRGKDNNNMTYNIYSADTNSISLLKMINKKDYSLQFAYRSTDKMLIVNDRLMFTFPDTVDNYELWSTDGTDTGTYMMKDIHPGIETSYPSYIGVVNNKLVFKASPNGVGDTLFLYVSDGTVTGTKMLKPFNPASTIYTTYAGSNVPMLGAVYKGSLYMVVDDHIHGQELWVTDGTGAGTKLVQDKVPGVQGLSARQLFMQGRKLWLSMTDFQHGAELYLLDASLPLSIKDVASNQPDLATIYPNPNTGSFSVELNNRGFKNGYLKVTDINGRTIYDQSIAQGTQQLPVTLSNTPTGVYMVTVQLDGEVMTQSIVVQ